MVLVWMSPLLDQAFLGERERGLAPQNGTVTLICGSCAGPILNLLLTQPLSGSNSLQRSTKLSSSNRNPFIQLRNRLISRTLVG